MEKISLLYTVFTSLKGYQVTQVPNIVLNNLWIENLSRSKAMKETVEVNVSYDTSFEDVELLRLEMEKFVRHSDNSRDFQQDLVIGIGGVGDLDKLTLKVVMKHKSNWHNESVRATRRSKFMCALALALKKIPIYGPGGGAEAALGSSDNPAYSVAVDDGYASSARDKAEKAADAARLVPVLKRSDTGRPQHVSEQQAVAELNMRPPLAGLDSTFGYERDEDGNIDNRNQPRDPSEDRVRNQNLEQVRADLVKRHSTRGRRRAGEGVPSAPLSEGQPGLAVTHYDTDGNVYVGSNRQHSYDVIQPGSPQPGSAHGYVGVAYGQPPQVSPRVAEAARESYSLYDDTGRYTSPPPTGAQPTGYGRELTPNVPVVTYGAQEAATAGSSANLAPTSRGARPRGASVSQVRDESERRQGSQGAKKQYTK